MAGRRPNIVHDRLKEGLSKKELENIEDSTPIFESQNFIPPDSLNEKELKVWYWLADIFRQTKNCMVSDADIHLMELYCRAKVDADDANEELRKNNRAYIIVPVGYDKDGNPKTTVKANPNIKKKHDNALLCLKFFDQLGLSPLARARAGVKGANSKNEESIWDKFLRRTDDD